MRLYKHDAISDIPTVFRIFLSDMIVFKFRMQSAFQINRLSFPIAYIRRYTEID